MRASAAAAPPAASAASANAAAPAASAIPSQRGRNLAAPLLAMCLALGACENGGDREQLEAEVIENYADLVHAGYEDALTAAQAMHVAIGDFLQSPSESAMDEARAAWLQAREPYGQTEAFRFYGGPIDGVNGPEPLINAWPLDEGYVDYVVGAPEGGIIQRMDDFPTLDAEALTSLNEDGAEVNVSVGYHAIEFLLWGQDLSEDGPGARPYTDYVVGQGAHAERRARYLEVTSQLLVDHLASLVEAWAPDQPANYRAEFTALPQDEAIRSILAGVGVLSKSELAGERMFTAYDNQDQEDEHSCFSDNTHRDIVTNAQGIANVLNGRYVRTDGRTVSGPGVIALVAQESEELADALEQLAEESVRLVEGIPVPFDRAIVEPESRPAVLEAVYSLQELGDRIAEAGSALGLTINTALPD